MECDQLRHTLVFFNFLFARFKISDQGFYIVMIYCPVHTVKDECDMINTNCKYKTIYAYPGNLHILSKITNDYKESKWQLRSNRVILMIF